MKDAGRIGFVIRGEYSDTETYDFLDVVYYNGSSYVAKKETTGNVPVEKNEFWQIFSSKGESGGVSGIKGEEESEYRDGYVIITAEDVGAVAKSGDTMTGILRSTANAPDDRRSDWRANLLRFILPSNNGFAGGIVFLGHDGSGLGGYGYTSAGYHYLGADYSKPSGELRATTFTGDLNGNATSATDADTVDGYHVQVVSELPSDAEEHPDTLYVIVQ